MEDKELLSAEQYVSFDLNFELEDIASPVTKMPSPCFYIVGPLLAVEIGYLFKLTNKIELNEENSLPIHLYDPNKQDSEELGRFPIDDFQCVLGMRRLGVSVLLKRTDDPSEEHQDITTDLKKFIRISPQKTNVGVGVTYEDEEVDS